MLTIATRVKKFLTVALWIFGIAAITLWLSPDLREQSIELLDQVGIVKKKKVFYVYKWRGTNGAWQYSQALPPKGIDYEVVEARTDINVLPRIPLE